ncbi:MAG: hypothetical protein ACLP3R_07815 [Candidatus Korobacteraceae bacterium]|jgi:hypothetical protein
MSSVKYANVEWEETPSANSCENRRSKLFAVPKVQTDLTCEVAARVNEVLNLQLARGSMPA